MINSLRRLSVLTANSKLRLNSHTNHGTAGIRRAEDLRRTLYHAQDKGGCLDH
jgi:hypothetical protein